MLFFYGSNRHEIGKISYAHSSHDDDDEEKEKKPSKKTSLPSLTKIYEMFILADLMRSTINANFTTKGSFDL